MKPQVANPPSRPLLIFDGDCNFCRRWIRTLETWTHGEVDFSASQAAQVCERFPEIAAEAFDVSVQFVETDGTVYCGAEAIFRSLSYAPGKRWLLRVYQRLPPFSSLSEKGYRFVASRRMAFSRLTRWILPPEPSTFLLVRSLLLRGLGLIYLIAFVSLWVQIIGLIGKNGILPANQFIEAAGQQIQGADRWFRFPTLSWLNTTDDFLLLQCALGTGFAVLLMLGILPFPCTIMLWALYLSLTVICREFLGFQWEALLLETGLICVFLAPFSWKVNNSERPPLIAIWLLRWLLFRLMFHSGVVKLASGDPTYRNFTALFYHYETQPLPTPFAWYVWQLPSWFHVVSLGMMFAIELLVAFFVLGPCKLRLCGFWLLVALQAAIALAGNYCYFNLLTVLLCLSLFDDAALIRFSPGGLKRFLERKLQSFRDCFSIAVPTLRLHQARGVVLCFFTVLVLFVTGVSLLSALKLVERWPDRVRNIVAGVYPFRSINSYGLFAVMTTTRPEIIIEGSNDGQQWLPYEFKYKPGDLAKRPRFVAPHQPRVDWQMWFAALGHYRQNPWFVNLCLRLLQGSPEVLGLLSRNPFPDQPPKYIRASLYEYQFTTRSQRSATGQWWNREYKGLYLPEISLQETGQSRK